jgi:hypothetical protein
MIAPQPPTLAVFISAQAMPGADMPSQRLPPVAAIEANHVVPVNGPSRRDSGSENLVWFGRLSKQTDRPMNGGNQIRKLIRHQPVMAHVAHDDFRR